MIHQSNASYSNNAPSGSSVERADRIPPHSLEAEQAVLGSLMLDKEAVIKIADIITKKDFYRDVHGMIFQSMLELYEKRIPIDLLSLTNILEEKDQLDVIGGRSFLASLASFVPTASNIVHHARIVNKKAMLRELIRASHNISHLAFNEEGDLDNILDEAEQYVYSVSQKSVTQNFIEVKSVLHDAFDRIDQIHKQEGGIRGLPTGFTDLDNILAGLQVSDLVILAARPSVGKTSLALDIARSVSMNSKTSVGMFSLEMSKEQLVDRIICSQAQVDSWKLRTGRLSNEDFERINHAMGFLAEMPLYIDDTAGINVMQMRTMARRLQSEYGLGLLVVDYLQLMEGRSTRDNRVEVVSEISRFLKSLARELKVPILALSQLSRAVEQRDSGIPKLSDLRESGSIEQDADVVLFIHRPGMYNPEEGEDANLAKILVAKHRNGPTGEVELYFQAEQASFRNLTDKYGSDPFAASSDPNAQGGSVQAAPSLASMPSTSPIPSAPSLSSSSEAIPVPAPSSAHTPVEPPESIAPPSVEASDPFEAPKAKASSSPLRADSSNTIKESSESSNESNPAPDTPPAPSAPSST